MQTIKMSPELINGIFALAGALLGAIVTGFMAWRQARALSTRKQLTATTTSPAKLLVVDRSVTADVEVRIRGRLVPTIYMTTAAVENTGNQVIEAINAVVEVTGTCEIINVEIGDVPSGMESSTLNAEITSPLAARVQIPFLNPGESVVARLLLSERPESVVFKCRQIGLIVVARNGYDATQPGAAGRVVYESLSQFALIHWYLRLAMPSYRQYWENEERVKGLKNK
jgi:hypothetical protein